MQLGNASALDPRGDFLSVIVAAVVEGDEVGDAGELGAQRRRQQEAGEVVHALAGVDSLGEAVAVPSRDLAEGPTSRGSELRTLLKTISFASFLYRPGVQLSAVLGMNLHGEMKTMRVFAS